MRGRARRPGRSRLFFLMGMLGVGVALTGFAKTFFYPLLSGTFAAHPIVYVHGLFLFGWVTFFLCQSLLVTVHLTRPLRPACSNPIVIPDRTGIPVLPVHAQSSGTPRGARGYQSDPCWEAK